MATINLRYPSPNGQHKTITGTFGSITDGAYLNLTSVTLGDGSTVANTFPGYVSTAATDAMKIPLAAVISVA